MTMTQTALIAMTAFAAAVTDLSAQQVRASSIQGDVPHYRENNQPYSCYDKYSLNTVLSTLNPDEDVPLLYVYRMYDTGQYRPANICKKTEEDVYRYAYALENDHKDPIRVNPGRGHPCMIIWSSEFKMRGLDNDKNMQSYMDVLSLQEKSLHTKQVTTLADTAITVRPIPLAWKNTP